MHYEFNPTVYKFEVLNRKVMTFIKSIDSNASITFSAKLDPIKVFNQSDYEKTMKNIRQKIISKFPTDFSGADNMGTDISVSSDEGGITNQPF